MNRCSKLSRYVYEIPSAFIGRISQAEPKKLASVVKPKTRCALGIAVVGYVGDHLKDKKMFSDPVSRVCAKCALKI